MPFYEYQCGACGKTHEAMQKVSDPPLRKCPACGKSRLRKLMSAPIFRLKGSGWYETDFKSDQDKKRNLAVDKDDSAKTKVDTPKADTAKTDAPKAEPAKKESKAEAPKANDNKRASRSAAKAKRPAARKARR